MPFLLLTSKDHQMRTPNRTKWATSLRFPGPQAKPTRGFPGGSDGKESACNMGDLGLIPGLGRSPEGGHGNSLQYSPRGQRSLAGYAFHGVPKSQTRLSDYGHVKTPGVAHS